MNHERTRRYRIAMVAACPFPSLRGSQVLVRELAEALAVAGHQVHVVTYPSGEHLVPVRDIAIHRTPSLPRSNSGSWGAKLLLDLGLMMTLYRVVRDHGTDLIHAHNYEGALVAYPVGWLLRRPVVYHTHNAMSDELPYYFGGRLARCLARWAGRLLDSIVPRQADYCVALTPELEDFLRKRGVAPSRVATIPPAIGLPRVAELPAAADLFPGREVVLYAGNIDPYQHTDVLLRAFAVVRRQRRRAILVIVAHPAKATAVRHRLEEIAAMPGVEVFEAASFGATRTVLSRADVVVCPRASWSGFPIKLLNFMSFGRAIVVCKSAAKAVTDGVTGVVVPDEDCDAMAAAIERLLDDVPRRTALGAAARRAVQSGYCWASVLPRFEAVYAHLFEEGAKLYGCRPGGAQLTTQNSLKAATEDRISPRAPTRRTGSE